MWIERSQGFPQFKKRKRQSIVSNPQRIRVENGWVSAPSIGRVRIRQSQAIELPTKSYIQAQRRRALVRNCGGGV